MSEEISSDPLLHCNLTADETPALVSPGSYTASRLHHATPEHLHLTSRRVFIGPVPKGWLQSHRKAWYSRHIRGYYSRKEATFVADDNVSKKRRLTNLSVEDGKTVKKNTATQDDAYNTEGTIMSESEPEPDTEDERRPRSPTRSTGLTIPERPNVLRGSASRNQSGDSFATARESLSSYEDAQSEEEPQSDEADHNREWNSHSDSDGRYLHEVETNASMMQPSSTSVSAQTQEATTSLSSLLHHDNLQHMERKKTARNLPKSETDTMSKKKSSMRVPTEEQQNTRKSRGAPGLVRFKTQDDLTKDHELQQQLANLARGKAILPGRRKKAKKSRDGEIVKMEKMLVRIDISAANLPEDYDENASTKIETRTVDKWREYVVVCRETGDHHAPMALKLYKTRVIPAVEKLKIQTSSNKEIPLNLRSTHVNLYSSLDKTLVIWLPHKHGQIIYVMRPRSAAISVEWYTFLSQALGWKRPSSMVVHVPDLQASIQIVNPFEQIDQAKKELDSSNPHAVIHEERTAASHLMRTSLRMIRQTPEWQEIILQWKERDRVGLAWKRYDRIEWIHGSNEEKMYGSVAMQKTHELELRPKLHYPTTVDLESGSMTEPPPVEGFLIRLTSGSGKDQRLGRLFFKRMYFYVHDNLLCFCKPATALPPPPSKLPPKRGSKVPSPDEIIEKIPLIYSITPFPITDGNIDWVRNANETYQNEKNDEAYEEAHRSVQSLLNTEGFIDLTKVKQVRRLANNNMSEDPLEGDDVDFHQEVSNTNDEDGVVDTLDDQRTFELVLNNGMTLKLQSYNKTTRNEWIKRLKDLVKYWKARKTDDLAMIKYTRKRNLKALRIDEEMESIIGQYGKKWEVQNSFASPQIWNICGISSCRPIAMAGVLYRKATIHATFKKYYVIACHGKILIYYNSRRKRNGTEAPHIHHQKRQEIALDNAYVYSGIITENDLLYQNQTFDSNHPGRHSLPRVYEDGWMSSDEDAMTCFVVWYNSKKSFVKSAREGKVKRVAALGHTGSSIVFKARSRQERDIWVMAIGVEIERLQTPDEIRVSS